MHRTRSRRNPNATVLSHSGTVQEVTLLLGTVCDSILGTLTSWEMCHSAVLGVQNFCWGLMPMTQGSWPCFVSTSKGQLDIVWPNTPTNHIVRVDNGVFQDPREGHSFGHSITKAWQLPPKSWGAKGKPLLGYSQLFTTWWHLGTVNSFKM